MQGKSISYFIQGNSAKGYVDFYQSNLGKLTKIIRIEGYPHKEMSDKLQRLGDELLHEGYDIEWIRYSLDNSVEGFIVPSLKLGIYQRPVVYAESNDIPSAFEYKVTDSMDEAKAESFENKRQGWNEVFQSKLLLASQNFAQALKIHDEWEVPYIKSMDFDKMNELSLNLINQLISDKKLDKKSNSVDRFFGCATVDGAIDYIDDLTQDVEKRYFIKGRPGTGKSTLLKKLVKNAQEKGIDTEIYHCGFDPNSLDMLILREIGICIFDSTAPHEYFPARESDTVIDVYRIAVCENVDETHAKELSEIQTRYKAKIKEATSYLKEAEDILEKAEAEIQKDLDEEALDNLTEHLENEIHSLLKSGSISY